MNAHDFWTAFLAATTTLLVRDVLEWWAHKRRVRLVVREFTKMAEEQAKARARAERLGYNPPGYWHSGF
jgi:hypothetical protein